MGLLRGIGKLLGSTAGGSTRRMEVKVRCSRCGEAIHGEIDLSNDLSLSEGSDQEQRYFCRKILIGTGAERCFSQVTVEYTFDASRSVIERRIEGGAFVDEGK